MADFRDILKGALGGNALDKLLAEGLKTLLCCSGHDVKI